MTIPRYWKEYAVEALNSGNDDYLLTRYLTEAKASECELMDIMEWLLSNHEITETDGTFTLIEPPSTSFVGDKD